MFKIVTENNRMKAAGAAALHIDHMEVRDNTLYVYVPGSRQLTARDGTDTCYYLVIDRLIVTAKWVSVAPIALLNQQTYYEIMHAMAEASFYAKWHLNDQINWHKICIVDTN